MRGCYSGAIHDARTSREPEISVVVGIVIARNGRLSDLAAIGMIGGRFLGLRRVRVTPGSMRIRSMMRGADLRSRCGHDLPGHQQIVAEERHDEQEAKKRPLSNLHALPARDHAILCLRAVVPHDLCRQTPRYGVAGPRVQPR
jgi:hypothetical protein